ncbi:uncharacterized protein [Tenebrio molitor]|uniref:uncharacterized protein isoform X2 n=1 Tax=Tenebrio molitor TaxID=7067 RepID=UPI0036249DF1
MYRQILIDSVDTDYQRILWRDHPNEELKTYRLTTFTYGTKPASFIATRCLFELAVQNQNMNPLASSVIKRDFYMDELLTGADTISELSAICEDVSTILQGGGFNLRKWTSNVPLTSPKMNNNCQKNGESLTAVHEGDITEVKTNRLSRWQLVERMRQLFWRRWTREYLSRLQARSKWRNPDTTPAVGSLVLIADDELPPLRWNLARITELHLGKDGLPRVASLKTKNGATKRSVHKLCVLPLEREDVHVLTHYE